MNTKHFSLFTLTPELQLLLDLVLRRPFQGIPEGLDWDKFRTCVDKHRLYMPLVRGLKLVPPEVLEANPELASYRSRQNQLAQESLRLVQALAQVAEAFDKAGIRMISMKGPLLAIEVYGDPTLRHSRDLDILVSEEDYFAACQLLTGLGYARWENVHETTPLRSRLSLHYSDDKHTLFTRDGVQMELHWRGSIWYRSALEDLWESHETRTLMGKNIHVMGRVDEWPYLISHATVHGYMRLRWLMDIYELQKRKDFSWEEIYRRMQQRGNGSLAIETMLVMFRLGLPMREVQEEDFRMRREGEEIVLEYTDEVSRDVEDAIRYAEAAYPILMIDQAMNSESWTAYRSMLPIQEEKRPWWHTIVNILRPEEVDFALIDLPDRWFWLYFLIRPVYWVWRKLFGGKK